MILDGKIYVAECPCNSAKKYEDFIWRHMFLIKEYFVARAEKEMRDAEWNSKLAEKVSAFVLNS